MDHPSQAYKSHTIEYIIVFVVLTILTGLELAIPGLDVKYSLKAVTLISLALGKAFTVAFFYMHLKEERWWLRFIASMPVFAIFLAAVTILDSIYR